MQIPPSPLKELLSEQNTKAKKFRQNIRAYNSALAFASLGIKIDNSIKKTGVANMRIHGDN